jgi:hypothetical protein
MLLERARTLNDAPTRRRARQSTEPAAPRHDRPWPERPMFGTFSWISHDGMKRKTDIQAYIDKIEQLARTGHDPFKL